MGPCRKPPRAPGPVPGAPSSSSGAPRRLSTTAPDAIDTRASAERSMELDLGGEGGKGGVKPSVTTPQDPCRPTPPPGHNSAGPVPLRTEARTYRTSFGLSAGLWTDIRGRPPRRPTGSGSHPRRTTSCRVRPSLHPPEVSVGSQETVLFQGLGHPSHGKGLGRRTPQNGLGLLSWGPVFGPFALAR